MISASQQKFKGKLVLLLAKVLDSGILGHILICIPLQ